MAIIVILHSISDVEHFFVKVFDKLKNYEFYVTHAGVHEYILEQYDIKSIQISSLFDRKTLNQYDSESIVFSQKILEQCDQDYSSQISRDNNLENISFFKSLYFYHLPYIYMGYAVLADFLNIKIKENNPQYIIYNYRSTFYPNHFKLKSFINIFLEKYLNNIDIQWCESDISHIEKKGLTAVIQKIWLNRNKIFRQISDDLYLWKSRYKKNKKRVLCIDALYDLNYIKKKESFSFVSYKYQSVYPRYYKKFFINEVKPINIKEYTNNTIEAWFKSEISRYFIKNYNKNISALINLDRLLTQYPVDFAIWGNPPTEGIKALIFEYCRAKEIPIVGMQHGAGYVDQYYHKLSRSDFDRCDYFISYGFKQSDFNKLYPEYKEKVKIMPFGTTKHKELTLNRLSNVYDILFPVTNTVSIIEGGFLRTSPHILNQDQKSILDILENEDNLKTLIKPFKNTNIMQTSIFYKINALRRCEVDMTITLEEALTKYSPKIIIIDFMSTPLYEVLDLDIEIFLFIREEDNITLKALEMLKKRVYLVEDMVVFRNLLNRWKKGELAKKRDSSYYDYFVQKENSKDNIVKFLEKL